MTDFKDKRARIKFEYIPPTLGWEDSVEFLFNKGILLLGFSLALTENIYWFLLCVPSLLFDLRIRTFRGKSKKW